MFLRKFLLAGAIVSFTMAGIDYASAETVQDHYKNIVVKRPYSVQVCSQGNGKSDLENLLEGAIIGGAIGNNVPGEDGGGAMGAIIGGILNSERNSGTRCQTETRYDEEYQSVYSHSTVTFYYNGRQYTLRFSK
jgi:outer membrane lipoprotein SlyB